MDFERNKRVTTHERILAHIYVAGIGFYTLGGINLIRGFWKKQKNNNPCLRSRGMGFHVSTSTCFLAFENHKGRTHAIILVHAYAVGIWLHTLSDPRCNQVTATTNWRQNPWTCCFKPSLFQIHPQRVFWIPTFHNNSCSSAHYPLYIMMKFDSCVCMLGEVEGEVWMERIDQTRKDGTLAAWVTTLLPGKPSYQFDALSIKGCFNLCQKLYADDGEAYMLRFPLVSGVSSDHADEKVAMEIEAIDLIREKTTIPVPKIYAWGLAKANPFGLGPFMLMEFIPGIELPTKFCGDKLDILQEDIPDRDVEFVYRQVANFMLQLFAIDFPRIGSLAYASDWVSCSCTPAHAESARYSRRWRGGWIPLVGLSVMGHYNSY